MFRPEKYSKSIRVLHWLMAALILGMLAVGYYMVGLHDDHPLKWKLYGLHKSIGVCLLVLIVIRVLARLISGAPLLQQFSKIERFLGNLSHKIMYLFMIFVPLSGFLASMYSGYGVAVFGKQLPEMFQKNEHYAMVWGVMHTYLPYFFLGLIAIHFLAVAKHYFIDRTNLLRRMW